MSTDIYLCSNAPHNSADIVLRPVAPCATTAVTDAGSHSSGGFLAPRPRRRPAKTPTHRPLTMPVVFDVEPKDLVVATFGINDMRALREQRDADALIACDAI